MTQKSQEPLRGRAGAPTRCLLLALTAMLDVGCQGDTWQAKPPIADMTTFRDEAYPVLLRDCSFNACHGSAQRFFQIFGPNRARINPLTHHDEPAEPLEVQVTYERTLSMLVTDGPVTNSLLLRKPLEERAGGMSHGGVDDFNRNVYQSVNDPGYVALLKWAQAAMPGAVAPVPLPAAGSAP